MRMKIRTPFWALLLAGGMLLFSCSQDHVFYTIQYDKVLNKNAAVPGSPTKIVRLGDALYVGSNAVYGYKKDTLEEGWRRLPDQPGGKRVLMLAGTEAGSGNYLYALVMPAGKSELSDAELYRKKPETEPEGPWERVGSSGFVIQSLHGAGDTLFLGVRSGGSSVLVYVDDSGGSPTLTQVPGVSGVLKAAARYSGSTPGKYYAAIEGNGLLAAANTAGPYTAVSDKGNTPTNFEGLIQIEDSLIAVSRSGLIWQIDSGGAVTASVATGGSLNGAVALWDEPDPEQDTNGGKPDLLLLGHAVSGGDSLSSYYYGYRELPITFSPETSTTPVLGGLLQQPGLPALGASTSVSNYNPYYGTLGTHPVISLYQAPWGDPPVLFASTQQDGLWSCRQGDDPKEWNVE